MTCSACGALSAAGHAAGHAACPACGAPLAAATEEEFEVVLKPRTLPPGPAAAADPDLTATLPTALGPSTSPMAPDPDRTAPVLPPITASVPTFVIDDAELGPAPAAPPEPWAAAPAPYGPPPAYAPPTEPTAMAPMAPPVAPPTVAFPAAPLAPAPTEWMPPAPAAPEPWRPAGAIGPPEGPPPGLPPADQPEGTPAWRRWAAGVGAGLVAVAVIGGVAFLLTRSDADQRTAGSILQAGQSRVTEFSGKANRSTRLITLRQVGTDAAQAADEVKARARGVGAIEDERLRERTAALLSAQAGYLEALGGLRGLDQKAVEGQSMPVWERIERDTNASADEIKAAQPALAEAELPGETTVDVRGLTDATKAVGTTLASANQQLRSYNFQLGRWQTADRKAKRKADGIAGYAGQVDAAIADYQAERKAVDRALESLDSTDYDGTHDAVQGFIEDRLAMQSRLRLISRPTGAEEAEDLQLELLTPVETSIEGLRALDSAVDYAEAWDEDIEDQSDFEEFRSRSAKVDAEIEAAQTQWRTTVDRLQSDARRDGVPPKPAKPRV